MDTRSSILRFFKTRTTISTRQLASELGISRQAVHKHLKEMVRRGEIVRSGTTKGSTYQKADAHQGGTIRLYRKNYLVAGLQEDRIFGESALFLNLKKALNHNSFEITQYAFTEMMNNVIDHSGSEKCRTEWILRPYDITFVVHDSGIGLFRSIETKFGLGSEGEALGELIKGKTTTMKERHSGEGIFFTSRIGDKISFRSHRILLAIDNLKQDVFVEEKKFLKGTEVRFCVSKRTRRKLGTVFAEFAPEEYEYRFEKTRVRVALLKPDFVSRSEARRLLRGLEKFQDVGLDFKKVKSIGQAFADEIFRVFPQQHPATALNAENTNPVLDAMIRHVRNLRP